MAMNGSRASSSGELHVHDSAIQALYGVGLQLQYCMQVADESPEDVKDHLDVALARLNDLIEMIRDRIYNIR